VNISHANPRKGAAQDDDSSTVSCRPTWQWPALPYNVIYDCEIVGAAGHWIWTVEPLEADNDESPWPTTNFGLRWRAAASTNHTAKKDGVRIWTGVGQFEVGKNMQGTCAASGFCVWGLKPESNPVLVDVASLLCQGTLEEALKGINCP
jgi:hypothetical protein